MRKNEHLFPKFHVRPPRGFVNDPNGACIIDGVFHLYFQYRDATSGATPVSWGHVSSSDLATWTAHRHAISPLPGGFDTDGVWSGNTIVSNDIVRAFYSGRILGDDHQVPLLAVSRDKGESFGLPRRIIPALSSADVHTFRDPYVWATPDGWAMVVGAGTTAGAAEARLYLSRDLEHWEAAGNLAGMPRQDVDGLDTGEMWECPQVVVTDQGDLILIVCGWSRKDGHYKLMSLVGPTTDGVHLAGNPTIGHVDYGPNLYAVSTMNSSPFGPLAWGWITEGRDASWSIEDDWSGMISLPRQIGASRSGRLESAPVESLASLRRGTIAASAGKAKVGAQFEFELSVAAGAGELRVDLSSSADEQLQLAFERGTGKVVIDRSRASRDQRAHASGCEIPTRENGREAPSRFRGFIDGSVLELFRDDGATATIRFYPLSPPPWTIDAPIGSSDGLQLWALS